MNGRERLLTFLAGGRVDSLPLMPITMMYAADHAGVQVRPVRDRLPHAGGQPDRDRRRVRFRLCLLHLRPGREAADCGARVAMFDDQPPAIIETDALLADKSALATLTIPDPRTAARMGDRVRAAALFRERVGDRKLIEGWIEGPCAEAADLRGINTLMMDFFDDPDFVRELFEFTLEMGIRFARAQVEAGVDLIGVGDAAASLVGPEFYQQFVWPYEKRLVDALHAMGTRVRLHICGNTTAILELMGQLGCDIVDLDFMVPMDKARRAMGPTQVCWATSIRCACCVASTPETIRAAIAQCHRQTGPRYIVGAGCEVPRATPPRTSGR